MSCAFFRFFIRERSLLTSLSSRRQPQVLRHQWPPYEQASLRMARQRSPRRSASSGGDLGQRDQDRRGREATSAAHGVPVASRVSEPSFDLPRVADPSLPRNWAQFELRPFHESGSKRGFVGAITGSFCLILCCWTNITTCETDITRMKQVEEEHIASTDQRAAEAEENRRQMELFVDMASHELRNREWPALPSASLGLADPVASLAQLSAASGRTPTSSAEVSSGCSKRSKRFSETASPTVATLWRTCDRSCRRTPRLSIRSCSVRITKDALPMVRPPHISCALLLPC